MTTLAGLAVLVCFLNVQSLSKIQFNSITPSKHLSQSSQEKTNANILETAYCNINTFQDPTTTTPTYYHWYTQTISNYTSVTALNDKLEQYSDPNNDISSQLPYKVYYSYSAFDSCVSPTTNDILTCYVVPSCCFGCAFIDCNMFFNNDSSATWSELDFFITGNQRSGVFAQKPQVSCMEDGYIVSWIYAKRQGPPSNDCKHQNKYGIGDEMVFSDYMIQYGTIDLNGNMKLSNETLFKFDTFDLVTAVNNFKVMTKNNAVHMTYAYNVTTHRSNPIHYVNISDLLVQYNGINKGLQLIDIDYYLDTGYSMDDTLLNGYQNLTATYKSIVIDVTDYCCIVTAFKYPFDDNDNIQVRWHVDVRYFNGTEVMTESYNVGGNHVGFVDIIELTMLNNHDNATEKYFALMYDDIPHSINVQSFILNATGDASMPIYFLNVGDAVELISNDSTVTTGAHIYSFCTHILPNSSNMVMAWAENPDDVNELTNVYVGSWEVTATK